MPRAAVPVSRATAHVEKQRELSSAIVGALGLAMQSNCRLDLSVHPFSTSFGPGDVRITTRFDANVLMAPPGAL